MSKPGPVNAPPQSESEPQSQGRPAGVQAKIYQCQDRAGQVFQVTLNVASSGTYPIIIAPYLGHLDLDLEEFNRLANAVVEDFGLNPCNWVWITALTPDATRPPVRVTGPGPGPNTGSGSGLVRANESVSYALLDFYCYQSEAEPTSNNAGGWRVWWDGTYRILDYALAQALFEQMSFTYSTIFYKD